MLKNQRLEIIKQLVEKEQIVSIERFLKVLESSESTIRRDLETLENEGFLNRIHGGVQLNSTIQEETGMTLKFDMNKIEKETIGEFAASLVEDNDCIFLDAGSTTYYMIPYLKNKNVTVITNGVNHIEPLINHHIQTHVVCGEVKISTQAIIGEDTIEYLNNYYFDKAFLGINGISYENGFSTPDPREATVKKTVLKRSKKSFFLADSNKFNHSFLVKIAELDDATVITDKEINNYQEKMTIMVRKK